MDCDVPQKTLGSFLEGLKWCGASSQPCIASPLPCPARENTHAKSLRTGVKVLWSPITTFVCPESACKDPLKSRLNKRYTYVGYPYLLFRTATLLATDRVGSPAWKHCLVQLRACLRNGKPGKVYENTHPCLSRAEFSLASRHREITALITPYIPE